MVSNRFIIVEQNYHFPSPRTPQITEIFPLSWVRIWNFYVNLFHFHFPRIILYTQFSHDNNPVRDFKKLALKMLFLP
jgi:hypothetical protein